MKSLTYHQAGHDYACVDDTGAIVGVLKRLNDGFIITHKQRPTEPSRHVRMDALDMKHKQQNQKRSKLRRKAKETDIERAIREYAERKRKGVKP